MKRYESKMNTSKKITLATIKSFIAKSGDNETCLTKEQIIEIYCRRETSNHGEQHEVAS